MGRHRHGAPARAHAASGRQADDHDPQRRDERGFKAVPVGKPGVYRSRVVFSKPGTWTYAIWDGFTQTHTYAPVRILT